MCRELVPQHFGRELKCETDVLARREPSDGRAIFSSGVNDEKDLIGSQSFKPLTKFPFEANRAARAPALEGIGGKDAFFRTVPVPSGEVALGYNSRQLRAERNRSEAEVVAG